MRYGFTFFFQPLNVKVDGFTNEAYCFFPSLTYGDTSRKIRNMCSPATFPFLDNNHVSHLELLLQTRLSKYGTKRSWGYIYTRFSCHRYGSWLRAMLELPVTATGPSEIPTI